MSNITNIMLVNAKMSDCSFYLPSPLSLSYTDYGIEDVNWLIGQLIELDWALTQEGERLKGKKTKGDKDETGMRTKREFKKVCNERQKRDRCPVWSINCPWTEISTQQNKSSLAELRYAFIVNLSSLFLLMLILTPVPHHKKIKASGGMDVPRKAAFYSTLDE